MDKITRAVEDPETILKGSGVELIVIKTFQDLLGGSSLVVVYRAEDDRGFIITAFPTKKVERLYRSRKVVWRQRS